VIALKIASRELVAALKDRLLGFRVFILCLTLGVMGIAAIGSLCGMIEEGLEKNGQLFLGGDAEIELTYRTITDTEKEWLVANSFAHSEVIDFRSMAVAATTSKRVLTQVKAVDSFYPLVGSVVLSGGLSLEQALAGKNDTPGVVVAPALLRRLQLTLGQKIQMGVQEFVVTATLLNEPDSFGNFALGPRSIVLEKDMQKSGLLAPGTLFSSKYRLLLRTSEDLDDLRRRFETDWAATGGKWKDSRKAAPGAVRAIERLSSFLVLIGLSGLVVGGIGVSAAVRAFVMKKTGNIAILKTLGATPRQIFWIHTIQISAYTLSAVILGVLLGALVPFIAKPFLPNDLKSIAEISIYPVALIEAAIYGFLAAAIFSIWPLAQTELIRPGRLFYAASSRIWPSKGYLAMLTLLIIAALLSAIQFSESAWLTLWLLGSMSLALLFLMFMAGLFQLILKQMVNSSFLQGRVALRAAISAIASGTEPAGPAVMGMGLGLAVLAAVGQIDGNLRQSITKSLPEKAPSFFFIDIQPDQLAKFNNKLAGNEGVDRVETAPMLRGLVTHINERPVGELASDHWVLRGDRGISYAQSMPEQTVLTEGQWWPDGYTGPAQISFAAEEAEEIGIGVGDTLTLNILGKSISANITSLREVDFSSADMGFVIVLNANALKGAPHSHIATVYAHAEAEIPLLNELGEAFPNVTGIQIREAVLLVSGIVSSIASAAFICAIATLITGVLILISAASANNIQRAYEAAILKTLGATRQEILVSFVFRSAMVGALAASVALGAGLLGGWGVFYFVFASEFKIIWFNAAIVLIGGVGATLITGVLFAIGPLSQSATTELRQLD
jgi:putative ABC transport system permease protein